MGLDFIRKAAKSFHKGLDRHRILLGTPHLFTQHPYSAPRAYAATILNGKRIRTGDQLSVRLDGEQVLALRGLDHVATFDTPPAELKNALTSSFGEAFGTVQQVHSMAGMAEIYIC